MEESHVGGLLEYPQYTRPEIFRGWAVPPVLLSGDHGKVASWRRRQSLLRTVSRRPDLLEKAALSGKDKQVIREVSQIKQ
jgi:tRNA (guanine37-N1)-methyltransferase